MIKAIVFDIFGVLYDSSMRVFRHNYLDQPTNDKFRDYWHLYERGRMSEQELIERTLEIAPHVSVSEIKNLVLGNYVLDKKLLGYVDVLHQRYKTAVLTNIGTETLAKLNTSINPHFDLIVASCEVGYIKPEPEIYRMVTDGLRLDPNECVFVDDKQTNVDGAKSIGMPGILYTGLPQLESNIAEILSEG